MVTFFVFYSFLCLVVELIGAIMMNILVKGSPILMLLLSLILMRTMMMMMMMMTAMSVACHSVYVHHFG
jgi:hypothetical protein